MKALNAHLRGPFWIVTLISGGLALLTFVALLAIYSQVGQWQYLALAAIAALLLLVHGGAWLLARRWRRFDLGMWLIAAAQIASAVIAPLFMADYWMIGPFLLAVVPLEIGVADRLRRMPLFVILSLLGTGGMLGADLLIRAPRLTILSDVPITAFLAVGLLVLHLAGLAFLFWQLRLRPESSHYTRLDLATQQSLLFTAISAASIVVVTGVLIFQIRASQIEQVGQNFQTLAKINAERVGNSIGQQIDALRTLGSGESVLLDGLEEANASYPVPESEALRMLHERELRWEAAPENSDFVLHYRTNLQSLALSKFRGAVLLHGKLLLTDRRGGLVAAQGDKPGKFYYADEAWWRLAWNDGEGGIYLGDLTIDPQTRVASIRIAVSVLDPRSNRNIGVLASTYELSAVQQDVSLAKTQVAGEVRLLASNGVTIAGPGDEAVGQAAWPDLLAARILPTGGDRSASDPSWLLGIDSQGNAAVLAHAPLATTGGINASNQEALRELGWQLVVSDTQANALAGVTRSTKIASLVGLLAMVLGVLAAAAMARVITRPIEALTTTAAAISRGQLDQRADPVGPVELVTLAESFNILTARLRSLINNLQDQVAQRTAQLEARVEQLATLNRITQTVASVRDRQAALTTVAREMVQLFNARSCAIALLNGARTDLTIVADYSRDTGDPSMLGDVIPLVGNLSSLAVIESGRPLVIAAPQTNPLTAPIHDLMRERGTQCLLIAPLLVRGEVIGTIGVDSNRVERGEFSAADLTLMETIAGQIASAIENARLFEEMQRAKESADAANRAKSAFLANMSHELRTPLNAVLGFAQVMERDPALPERQREHLGIITRSGEHLLGLINAVLEMSKIEAGQVLLNSAPFDLRRLLLGIEEMFQLRAESKHMRLVFEIAPEVPRYVAGDESKLRQVLINLLGNAIKFTHQGGVTLRATWHDQQASSADPNRDKEPRRQGDDLHGNPFVSPSPGLPASQASLVVEVEDTGEGIAADQLPNLFQPFVQTASGVQAREGTGLGLAISRQFVRLMGGDIAVASALGQGTRFTFDVRIAPADPAAVPQEQAERRVVGIAPESQQEYRILVADDKWENRRLLVEWLQAAGFLVREAGNGQEAIETWERWAPHLIWMDMRMPVLDGYEATRQIKASAHGPATVVIALTASAFEHEQAVVLSVGCDDFVPKPVRESTIFEKIAQHLGVHFIYDEPRAAMRPAESVAPLTPSALAGLPAPLLAALGQAADDFDPAMAQAAIAQIRAHDAAVADGLAHLLANYRFDTIETLVQESSRQAA